jgi:hypothetical protein
VFLVLVAKAPASVWKVKRSMAGKIVNLGHPPFAAQVILNGHEYVRISLHRRLPAE